MGSVVARAANKRPGVDAGWTLRFAFSRAWPRATQAGRYCDTRLCAQMRTHKQCESAVCFVIRILGRPAGAALLPRWEALLTMDRWHPGGCRENNRKGTLPLGTSIRTRARIRAVWLISTKPLHRRYA